jgi:hypothetical protein
VDDALVVRRLETLGDLESNPQCFLQWNRGAVDALSERFTLGKLHDEQLATVDVLEPVDPGDARVVEGGQDPGLALESSQSVGVGGEGVGQDLDGHLAAELGVLRPPHLAHAALAELVDDSIVCQRLTDHPDLPTECSAQVIRHRARRRRALSGVCQRTLP